MNDELELILLTNGHIVPEWVKGKVSKNKKEVQDKLVEYFNESPQKALFYLGFAEVKGAMSASVNFWHSLSHCFVNQLRLTENIEELREKALVDVPDGFFQSLLEEAPFFQGAEYLSSNLLLEWWDLLNKFYQKSIKPDKGTVAEFLGKYANDVHLADRIYFHLVENRKDSISPFAFLATYSAAVTKEGRSQHRPLRAALNDFADQPEKLVELLSTVYKVAEHSPLIHNIVDSGELFHPLGFESEEAFEFLNQVPEFEENGILCRIPNWWKGARKGVSIAVSFGEKKRSLVGLESLLDFNMSLTVAGQTITLKEAQAILDESQGLALIKGRWVTVDREKLSATLDQWELLQEMVGDDGFTLSEAMRVIGGLDSDISAPDGVEFEADFGSWMKSVFEKMRDPEMIKDVKTTKDFKAELRPYQQKGLNWLALLGSINFGACLADDMGLGKTIQVIALINSLRRKKAYSCSLLIVPASLIHNWASELTKFGPNIKFAIGHPSGGEHYIGKKPNAEVFAENDIIITTYGLAKKTDWIHDNQWNYVILDEAQAIKNAGTLQTKAVKRIQARNRLALTGTPIENNLGDLWSLFDFLNPGLLGSKNEFKKLIKDNDGDYSRIRKIISPYILRRLKTDKSIISDLPDKIEVDSYSQLTKKQAVLYQEQVQTLAKSLEEADETGIERKGLVLSTLMKFKQICNHPSQFLGDGEFNQKHSGKFERLKEICETVHAKRERILIFTQFKEMTDALNEFMEQQFGRSGFVLHGGTPIKHRKEMVEKFQSDDYHPFFILSLKAGGTGLNLTAANHVVHFDRWWNPAVENQATDRAFRIGQKKSVVVHKFITEGTFEEKVDEMLKEKSALSDNLLADTKSSWITEMNNDELISMFSMGGTK